MSIPDQKVAILQAMRIAFQHHQAGRLSEAEAVYRQVLMVDPDYFDALHFLGVVTCQAGKNEQGIDLISKAIQRSPSSPGPHNNLGEVYRALNRLDEAEACYKKALALMPDMAEAHNNLGNVFMKRGRLDEAVACYKRALALKPEYAEAYNNLGTALQELGRLAEAVENHRKAIRLKPDYAAAHFQLGNAYRKQKKPEAARDHFNKALQINPHGGEYYGAMAHLLLHTGDIDATEKIGQDILSRLDEICAARMSKDFGSLVFLCPYLSLGQKAQDALMEKCDRELRKDIELYSLDDIKKSDKIRIGYVSPFFGNHPIGHVTKSIFKEHDRGDFEISVYSLKDRSNESSGQYRDIRETCNKFIDISSLSPRDAAKRIASDGISILIDLSGYMSYESMNIFSYRPAPIQMYWLGHGGGLGLSFIDYVIADAVVIPPGEETRYKEKILRLPEVYHSTDTPPISDNKMQRSDHGLTENAFVYCAFNNPKKIDRKVFDSWMNILHRVPGSQLWLSRLQEPELLVKNLKREAEKRGVDPKRLVFAPRVADKSVHFARHRLADLFLDTFAYNASTTAIDTLWAGLPILTCRGDTFYSRICSSMLTNIGLQDLICDGIQAYEDKAVYFAKDRNALAEVRERLARNRGHYPLFNVKRFVSHLEAGYREIWKRFQENQPFQNVDIPPLP